jgi:imidazolonepropionase-like amidohydrolase
MMACPVRPVPRPSYTPTALRMRTLPRWPAGLAALLLAPLLLLSAAAPAAQTSTVYVNATLIDGTGAPARPKQTIVVADGHIGTIGSSEVPVPAGAKRVDLKGKFVIPGLVNSHVHLATEADPAEARKYLKRELFSGVTTVRDMAGDARLLAELKREAELDEIPSPDIYFAAVFAGPQFFTDPRVISASKGRAPGEAPWARAITDQSSLPVVIAEARGCGATAIKLYSNLSADLVRNITAEAHRQGLLVWAHAAVFPARPSDVLAAGVDVISHAQLIGYEAFATLPAEGRPAKLSADEVAQHAAEFEQLFANMAHQGTILDATLNTYAIDPTLSRQAPVGDGLAKQAYQARVPISVGTDDDFDWNSPDSVIFDELRRLAERAGMSLPDLLHSATAVGARTVGQDESLGTIEVGKVANLVVLTRNPLEDVANYRSVELVVKHGIAYQRTGYVPPRPPKRQHKAGR